MSSDSLSTILRRTNLPYFVGSTLLQIGAEELKEIFEGDDVVAALQVIDNTLNRIDQAIVQGFGLKNVEMARLDDALATLNSQLEVARAGRESLDSDVELGTGYRGRAHLRGEWQDYAEQEARLQEAINTLHGVRLQIMDELNGAEPASWTVNGDNCCCPHQQVMGAVNRAMPVVSEMGMPELGALSRNDNKISGLEESAAKGKLAIDNLISPEAKANLDEFSTKFTGIFEQASRDGKITAGEIGNSFKQMAMDILHDQVFSKLFAGMGPLGAVAGNLLGGLLGGGAGGGNVEPNIPVLVGERGPELLVLNQGGAVITLQHDRAEAVIGAIRYGLGEIASTPI